MQNHPFQPDYLTGFQDNIPLSCKECGEGELSHPTPRLRHGDLYRGECGCYFEGKETHSPRNNQEFLALNLTGSITLCSYFTKMIMEDLLLGKDVLLHRIGPEDSKLLLKGNNAKTIRCLRSSRKVDGSL